MAPHAKGKAGNISRSAQLKEEGNAFFKKKDYARASSKYTEAIALDPENAILYGNRAACRLQLGHGQYLDALVDAQKCTTLDPKYVKGYGRLAAAYYALDEPDMGVKIQERALYILPERNLDPAQTKLKHELMGGFLTAKTAALIMDDTAATRAERYRAHESLPPWNIARALGPKTPFDIENRSCIYLLYGAYRDFSAAVNAMKGTTKTTKPGGKVTFENSMDGVLQLMTRGITNDQRVIHIDEPSWDSWVARFRDQVNLETHAGDYTPEPDALGPAFLMEDIPRRVETEGWDAVRPVLAATIRSWVLTGAILKSAIRGKHDTALAYLDSAIQVIRWGRERWKDVPSNVRGDVFDARSLCGVVSLYLQCYMKAFEAKPTHEPGAELSLKRLHTLAIELEKDCGAIPPDKSDSFLPLFQINTQALCIAAKGYCKAHTVHHTLLETDPSADHSDIMTMYNETAGLYSRAASMFPEDDEYCAIMIATAVKNGIPGRIRLHELLFLKEKLETVVPKMKRIWTHSIAAKEGRDALIAEAMQILKEAALAAKRDKTGQALDKHFYPEVFRCEKPFTHVLL